VYSHRAIPALWMLLNPGKVVATKEEEDELAPKDSG